jgi:oxygen-dependent protoporphyrinogen oxidase
MKAPIAIIGGGLAGLTAAVVLRRRGIPFRLYEAAPKIGGLASSFEDEDGFSHDFGAHFITNRFAAALGIEDECVDVTRYGESVVVGERTHAYPLGLLAVPRFVASAIAQKVHDAVRPPQIRNAAECFEARYGAALAREVAIPLAEAWSGIAAEELSPAVLEQIPGSVVRTAALKLASLVSGRPIASGYCRSKPESPNVWHVYPRGGMAAICARLASQVEDAIVCNSPLEAVEVENGRVTGIRVNGVSREASAAISTAPVHLLAKLVRGSDALDELRRFRYRPMILVNLRMQGRGLLPNVVTWTPDRELPFFRLTEAPLAVASLAPPDKTTITVDIGAEVGDARWSLSDDALVALCLSHLTKFVPDASARYLSARVLRTPFAYPVFRLDYEVERRRLAEGLPIAGLHSVGRNGEFLHILMEDVYWRTTEHANRAGDLWWKTPQKARQTDHYGLQEMIAGR